MKKRILAVCLLASTMGCGQKISFSSGSVAVSGSGKVASCQPGTTTVTRPAKFLFIVDQSGSNVTGPYEHQGQATDPSKSFRFGAIDQFFLEYQSYTNLSWGFLTFQDTSAQSLILASGKPAFSNSSAMSAALQTFLGDKDDKGTPYLAALQAAHDLIAADIAAGSSPNLYRIAFITDGYPDSCYDPTGNYCQSTMDPQIMADINSIVNLSPGSIIFNTVYYGFPDVGASTRLQNMASAGGGQYVDARASGAIHLDNVMQVPVPCP